MAAEASIRVQAEPLAADPSPPLRHDDATTDAFPAWTMQERLIDVLLSGRNSVSLFDMLSLDAEYPHTSSPRVGAVILLRTPRALVRGHAA